MREKIIKRIIAHSKGNIEKHNAKVEILMQKTAGVESNPET